MCRQREIDYYSTNLSILNIWAYSDWNLFWDVKILRTQEIMLLFKWQIPQFFRLFWIFLAGPPISIFYLFRTLIIPWLWFAQSLLLISLRENIKNQLGHLYQRCTPFCTYSQSWRWCLMWPSDQIHIFKIKKTLTLKKILVLELKKTLKTINESNKL